MASNEKGVAGDNLESTLQHAKKVFTDRLGGSPSVVAYAPGRVNLIGEHTDYNNGCVFPMVSKTFNIRPYSNHVTLGTPEGNGYSWSSAPQWRGLSYHYDCILRGQ